MQIMSSGPKQVYRVLERRYTIAVACCWPLPVLAAAPKVIRLDGRLQGVAETANG
jgi:hypothetical protein